MTIWRPKTGPIFTKGRLVHLAWGAALEGAATLAGALAGDPYSWSVWALVAIAALGVMWEILTPALAYSLHWAHPFGDGFDVLAYWAGAGAVACVFWGLM